MLSGNCADASGHLTFHVNGFGLVRYVVQKTSDFKTWIDADILIGEGDFTEVNSSTTDPAFYQIKIVEPPPSILP